MFMGGCDVHDLEVDRGRPLRKDPPRLEPQVDRYEFSTNKRTKEFVESNNDVILLESDDDSTIMFSDNEEDSQPPILMKPAEIIVTKPIKKKKKKKNKEKKEADKYEWVEKTRESCVTKVKNNNGEKVKITEKKEHIVRHIPPNTGAGAETAGENSEVSVGKKATEKNRSKKG